MITRCKPGDLAIITREEHEETDEELEVPS